MSSTDLEGSPLIRTSNGWAINTMIDGVMEIRGEKPIRARYLKDPETTSRFLIAHNMIDELFMLWHELGKPEIYCKIEEETSVDALALYKDIKDNQEVLQKAYRDLQNILEHVQQTMDTIDMQNKKWEFVKRRLKVIPSKSHKQLQHYGGRSSEE
jgi:hypothetical protein